MSATKISFNPRNLGEFTLCDPKLLPVLAYLILQWPEVEMLIGDIHRTPEEEKAAGGVSGIHVVGPPYRAIDVKVKTLGGDPWAQAVLYASKVNARYEYDPTRPEKLVAFAKPHGTGPHIHLQVHQNTRRRVQEA